MKRIVIFVVVAILIGSCSSYNSGELVGVDGRKAYAEPDPFGMVAIPNGSFVMGPSDQDVTWTQNSLPRTVAVDAFWMDETEITNNEYRQFVFWVRDSIIRKELAMQGIDDFILKDRDDQPYEDMNGDPIIDWDTPLDPSKDKEGNIAQIIEDLELYYTGEERLSLYFREINPTKLIYNYYWVALVQAANPANGFRLDYSGGNADPVVSYNGTVVRPSGEREDITGRSSFVNKDWVLVYPDTLVWVRDFTFSFNEPMTNMYFSSPSYDNYPVVGVTWKQANAFCIWRTNFLNQALVNSGQTIVQDYRLPIEAEWEYAARGGHLSKNNYNYSGSDNADEVGWIRSNSNGETHEVGLKKPNDLEIYDMSGNVSEWCWDWYFEYNSETKINPKGPGSGTHRLERGGSWKYKKEASGITRRHFVQPNESYQRLGFRIGRSYL